MSRVYVCVCCECVCVTHSAVVSSLLSSPPPLCRIQIDSADVSTSSFLLLPSAGWLGDARQERRGCRNTQLLPLSHCLNEGEGDFKGYLNKRKKSEVGYFFVLAALKSVNKLQVSITRVISYCLLH